MTYPQSAVLGVVQGLTEYLPVSSSAHLALFPWIFGWDDPGHAFDAALHLGTLAAALYYYRSWFLDCILEAGARPDSRGGILLAGLAVGTIPGGIAGLALEKRIEHFASRPPILAACLILFALLLAFAARVSRRARTVEDVTIRDAFLIGCAQALALFPGVSRSGITITAALFLGLNFEAAATYSFLLGVPLTAAAALHSLIKLPPGLGGGLFWTGLAAAAVTGVLGIELVLGGLRRMGTAPFVVYRIVAGLGILALWFARGG